MNTTLVERITSSTLFGQFKEEFLEMLKKHQIIVLSGPTGIGKSTGAPLAAFLDSFTKVEDSYEQLEGGFNKFVVTVPSRTAAASLCERVSCELGTTVGDIVGYQTGYDKEYSERTRILYTTEGLELMKELHNADTLENGVLFVDELQEWSINVETLIAWIHKKIKSGWKTKVVLMSATMDVTGICKFFGDIPVLNIPGRLFEITEYERRANDFVDSIYEAANRNHNVLAFVPGKKEIEYTIEALKRRGLDASMLPLHGDLPLSEQQIVFLPTDKPKVIVATNVAQTSITIPDIDVVVDTGLERHMENVDGLDTLTIGQISRSDYIQRRGRAGRTKPGSYIWCNDTPMNELAEYPTPDIFTGNIDQIVLKLGSIGIDAREVNFFHQPPIEKIEASQKTLRMLGAFDEENVITDCGMVMAQLPLSVRYARMIVESHKRDVLSDVVTIAALSEFGGIKASNTSYEGFSKEMKSDLLAELDCFNTVQRRIDRNKELEAIGEWDKTEDPFAGIIERNYDRVKELRKKLADILYSIYGDVSSSGNRNEILRSCAAGLVEFLYSRTSNGWYVNPNDGFKRKLNLFSATLPSKYLLGLPKNIALNHKGNTGNQMLYLISSAIMVDVPILEDVAPHLIHTKTQYEFRYETGEYLSREVRFFGDVEIGAVESKVSNVNTKRELLAAWLANVTVDEDVYVDAKLDKALKKAINRNYGVFNDFDDAHNFYSQRLKESFDNSLPNMRKCKNFAFLVA